MTAFSQRRQTSTPSQHRDSYERLLADYTDDIEKSGPASKTSLILTLLCSCYSWARRLRGFLPSQLRAYSRQLYMLKMAGKVLLRCASAARALPAVCIAALLGFVAAISFTWIWCHIFDMDICLSEVLATIAFRTAKGGAKREVND
ncbi:hypothetical protein NLG97_g1922 [Lecanicillium saksenae]|uniref:Uncharacterized protein n=1 Tax=Lecanicillium saksenae TaxID=468837 RepID=A0ACC1R485_9HYPO|nr:hypothetical protein NLG97_g1922 [Lecanicillium saksenae]